jgi:hypothetical protein
MTRPLFWLTAVLLAGSAGESFAGIVLVRNDSSVVIPGDHGFRFDQTGYDLPWPSNTVTADPGASDFSALFVADGIPVQADQYSHLQGDTFVGQGDAFADPGATGAGVTSPVDVHSIFDVTFEVTAPSWFVLSANNYVGGVVNPADAFLRSLTSSLGPSPILVEEERPSGEFFSAGELLPGVDYRLVISASEVPLSGTDATHWQFTFALPEPALPLELAGLLALGLVLRRALRAQKIV